MGTLVVRLFGAPEIVRDGEVVGVDTRKAVAVLALLAVEDRPVRRDVIAARLWPEATQERARASLRRTLSALRSAIGPDAISADRETIDLALGPEAVDVLQFEHLAANAPMEALALYRGPFLEGFSVPDAPDFEDWQRGETERCKARVDALLAASAESAEPSRAAELARRRLELDPLNEAACRQAMTAMGKTGDRSGAIAEYRSLVRRLDEDLGVEPLAETTKAYEAVRRGDQAVELNRARSRSPASPPQPPLIGRADDLEALTSAIEMQGLVIVAGEPGIGRSRMLDEWATTAPDGLMLHCHVGEQAVPYGPLRRWLDRQAEAQVAIFEDIADALPLAAGGVLVVDDLQLADPATAAFLTYVVHRRDRFGWSVIASWRASRVVPGDSCWELLTEGRREGWASEFSLGRLSRDDVVALVEVLGGATPARTTEIVDLAEGLPLVVVEAMRLSPDNDAVPPVVEDLMRSRLASLSPLAVQIVEAMAIIDRPSDDAQVQAIAGRGLVETAAALEELMAADIVRSDGKVRLAHSLLGQAALAGLSESRIRLLHERAGAALPAAEAADHLARAGRQTEAAGLFVLAADQAVGSQAMTSALQHLQSALALGVDDDAVVQRRIGDIESLLGHYEAARRAYEIGAARSVGPELVKVEIRLARLALRSGDDKLAASHLDSADAELAVERDTGTASLAVDVAICRALVAAASGGDGADAASTAVDMAQAIDDPAIEAAAESTAALIAYWNNARADAVEHAGRAVRLSVLAGAPLVEAAASNLLGLVQGAKGEHDDAIACFEQARSILSEHGDVHRLAAVHANLGDALHCAGNDEGARKHQLESARLFSEVSGPPMDGRADLWLLTAW